MKKLLGFVQEADGQFSSARLLSLLITISIVIDYMHAVFTVGYWHPDINLILILLVVVTGKTVQKFTEAPASTVLKSDKKEGTP